MNQVNLKSLDFTWKRIANLLVVFPDVVSCDIDFLSFFAVAFDPLISWTIRFVVDRVVKLVFICISCWSRWFTSTNPKKVSAFTTPPSTSCTREQSSQFLCNRWLLVFIHQPFGHVHQIYKRLHCLFWGILTIHYSRVMHWQPAVFTVLAN